MKIVVEEFVGGTFEIQLGLCEFSGTIAKIEHRPAQGGIWDRYPIEYSGTLIVHSDCGAAYPICLALCTVKREERHVVISSPRLGDEFKISKPGIT